MTTFTVTGTTLHQAAAWASRIVPSRPGVPILGSLLVTATEDGLTLAAFDYDTAASVTVSARDVQPGAVALSARLLAAVAKAVARDVDVTLTAADGLATVRCGRSEWSLPTMPAEDFPGLPGVTGDPDGVIDAEVLRGALGRVLPTISTDETRQALRGLKLDSDGDTLRIVGTDSYRVGVAEVAWKPVGSGAIDALVPADLLEMASRVTGGSTISLHATSSVFGLVTDTHSIVGRQIAAQYPVLSRFMPTPGEHYAVINVAELRRATDEAMVVLDETPIVRLAFTDGEVQVSAAGDNRNATAVAPLHDLAGEPVEVNLNAGYLLGGLKALESDAAILYFAPRSVLALPSDAGGQVIDGYAHVVMRIK